MGLARFEKQFEALLVKGLAQAMSLPEDRVEELVVAPGDRSFYLRGGQAVALLARVEVGRYCGCVQAVVPCPACQARGATFRMCKEAWSLRDVIDGIDPGEVPEEFHRDVGQRPVEIGTWDWCK